MKEKVKNAFLEVNWLKILHFILLFIFLFYINFSLINFSLLREQISNLPNQFVTLNIFNVIAYIISILGVAIYLSNYIKKRFFVELISGYVIYSLVSYFLVVTRNLNNDGFIWWHFFKNDFLQYSFLPTIILIVGLATLIFHISNRLQLKEKIDGFLVEFDYYPAISIGLIASLALNDNLFLDMMSEKVADFIEKGNYIDYLLNVAGSVAITLILSCLLVYFVLNSYTPLKENRPNYAIVVVLSFFLALVFNYLFQYGIKSDGAVLDRYIFPSATLFQIVVIALFNLLL